VEFEGNEYAYQMFSMTEGIMDNVDQICFDGLNELVADTDSPLDLSAMSCNAKVDLVNLSLQGVGKKLRALDRDLFVLILF
jgi:hypothetical protein